MSTARCKHSSILYNVQHNNVMYKQALLDKLQYFIWESILHFINKQQAEPSNYFIFTFLLLLLAYNYTWIIINSDPHLALSHSCMASCRPGLQLVA